jgi:Polyketide cyclase / dehydrase and lipid transport
VLLEGQTSLHVDAPPDVVYALVSDVTRTGEWSPECYRARWLGGACGPAVGARFRGWNRWGLVRWPRTVEVLSADPGRQFTFQTVPNALTLDSTTWRYQLQPEDGGTRLTERYHITAPLRFPATLVQRLLLPHHADMRPHLRISLQRIKTIAEAAAGVPPSGSASGRHRGRTAP